MVIDWQIQFKMEEQINKIVFLFSNAPVNGVKTETWDEYVFEASILLDQIPDAQNLISLIPETSERDSWRLIIQLEAGDSIFDLNDKSGDISNIERDLEPYKNDKVRIKFLITKSIERNKLTVYDIELFTTFLQKSTLKAFLNAVNNRLKENLTIEVWSKGFRTFNSKTVAFVSKGETEQVNSIGYRLLRVSAQEKHCLSNIQNLKLLPDDFLTSSTADAVSLLFRKASLVLSMLFVCDNSSIENVLKLGICGYKSFRQHFDAQHLSDLDLDDSYCSNWFDIYDWAYTGGYTSDRLSIARNIISLNIQGDNIVAINESTLRSIKSNFKIFERDNVRQYIKIRNEISNLLIGMQREVNSILECFASDFKKNILAVFTFFFTVVIVRVISKGDFTGGFTTPIFILSMIFLALSVILLIYSRRELEKKMNLFKKHYDQLKNRYKCLLSDEETTEMFEDCDPNKLGSHANYLEWQKKVYTWLWIACIAVLTVFALLAWKSNLTNNLYECPTFKLVTLCCIKNI